MEEEELAALRKQQREFEEMRNAEKVEQQRLEEQERRLREEKQRRMKQANEVLKLEKETAEKLAANVFSKSYISDLLPSVFNNLKENGYFFDPIQRDLEAGFMPFIMDQTLQEVEDITLGRLLLDEIIKEVVAKREDSYDKLEKILIEKKRQEEESRLSQAAAAVVNSVEQNQDEQNAQQGEGANDTQVPVNEVSNDEPTNPLDEVFLNNPSLIDNLQIFF